MTGPARTTEVLAHTGFVRGEIDRRIFGSFVEHMGRCVYTGVFEPDHPRADAAGFRTDVAELITELGVTTVRYPGGNFVSGYDWADGVGPVDQRPTRVDLAWRSIEPNLVGPDEFLPWARSLGLEPMMAVNLGTRGAEDAARLVEYCNLTGGTALSDQRRRNGRVQPHDVRMWCLGNEMDGPWQLGHTSARDYGVRAAQAGQAMKLVDPTIELVACGSSHREMPTFGAWEDTVLDHAWDVVDHLSVHAYYDGQQARADFLASGWRLQRYLDDVIAIMDAVAARRRSTKIMTISLDEWNVWSSRPDPVDPRTSIEHAPPITEDPYQSVDAVVLGDLLISVLNRTDRVAAACLSLLVNVSAPIMTTPGGSSHRQSIFHPMALTSRLARGRALDCRVDGGQVSSPQHGDLPAVGVAITHDPDSGRISVFLTNRGETAAPVRVRVDDAVLTAVRGSWTIEAAGADSIRTGTDVAAPGPLSELHLEDGVLVLCAPPTSWSVVDLDASGRRRAG